MWYYWNCNPFPNPPVLLDFFSMSLIMIFLICGLSTPPQMWTPQGREVVSGLFVAVSLLPTTCGRHSKTFINWILKTWSFLGLSNDSWGLGLSVSTAECALAVFLTHKWQRHNVLHLVRQSSHKAASLSSRYCVRQGWGAPGLTQRPGCYRQWAYPPGWRHPSPRCAFSEVQTWCLPDPAFPLRLLSCTHSAPATLALFHFLLLFWAPQTLNSHTPLELSICCVWNILLIFQSEDLCLFHMSVWIISARSFPTSLFKPCLACFSPLEHPAYIIFSPGQSLQF